MKNIGLPTIAILLLSSCASQETFRQGKESLADGRVEEGLGQLEKAVAEQPGNLEYRSYLARQRDLQISRLLRDADTARINGRWDEAEAGYRRVLGIDANNQRAAEEMSNVAVGRRHETAVAQAESMFKKNDLDGALQKVREVLAENAGNKAARGLYERIEQKRLASNMTAPKLKSAFKKPISLEFKDANLKAVFELIAKTAGINFIFDKDLRPDLKASIFVRNTTIEEAINVLLLTNQLERKVLNENSMLIYPNTKNRDYQELVVKNFYLANADAKQTVNLIKSMVKTKDIYVDEKLNMLVMRDTPEAIRVAEKLIVAQDMADPEVVLEVEVMEISRNRLQELGMRYPNQMSVGIQSAAGAGAGSTSTGGQLSFKELTDFGAANATFSITNPAFVLNLRRQDSETNLLANPHIRVKNREKAKIHIGDRVPVITSTSTSTGFVAESVNYLDVGLKLDVEPNVMIEDEVSIKVGLEVSNIVSEVASKSGTLTYRVGTRNASTVLRLKNGETQILAGLINDEERSTADKVPGLANLPLIGRLFSSKKETRDKTEIVLLITPRIVRNVMPPDVVYTEYSSGTEAAVGGGSMSLHPTEGAAVAPTLSLPAGSATPPTSVSTGTQKPLAVPDSGPKSTPLTAPSVQPLQEASPQVPVPLPSQPSAATAPPPPPPPQL